CGGGGADVGVDQQVDPRVRGCGNACRHRTALADVGAKLHDPRARVARDVGRGIARPVVDHHDLIDALERAQSDDGGGHRVSALVRGHEGHDGALGGARCAPHGTPSGTVAGGSCRPCSSGARVAHAMPMKTATPATPATTTVAAAPPRPSRATASDTSRATTPAASAPAALRASEVRQATRSPTRRRRSTSRTDAAPTMATEWAIPSTTTLSEPDTDAYRAIMSATPPVVAPRWTSAGVRASPAA